tara:strand:+ start:334 stop:648 length:315 start_codon:yes stop_codon:yes gene_type:complete
MKAQQAPQQAPSHCATRAATASQQGAKTPLFQRVFIATNAQRFGLSALLRVALLRKRNSATPAGRDRESGGYGAGGGRKVQKAPSGNRPPSLFLYESDFQDGGG